MLADLCGTTLTLLPTLSVCCRGAFATVKLCLNRYTGKKYAAKVIEKKKFKRMQKTSRDNAVMVRARMPPCARSFAELTI